MAVLIEGQVYLFEFKVVQFSKASRNIMRLEIEMLLFK